ncbi:hypothetical protein BDF14DRAFT_1801161 [Spinellus fusiger]|nr:hypothetical protein BDF14DRAFT_1801161 [Spinellus fusiger]
MAATCVYLACKVEESSRKLSDIISALLYNRYNQVNHTNEKTKFQTRCRDTILYFENVLLETLCFDLTIDHPHQLIVSLAEEIKGTCTYHGRN